MISKFDSEQLVAFGQRLLAAHGLNAAHAETTARHLVEAELLGFKTHGIDLLPIYVSAIAAGKLAKEGSPTVVSDSGANVVWDGEFLSGQALIDSAVRLGMERLDQHGIVTVVVRRCHHTGCHASHLLRPVQGGALAIITAASTEKRIAPIGGTTAVFSPSPFAVGIPTGGEPILIDMTMASTARSVCRQHYQRGERLPHKWLLTADGEATDDPAAMYEEPIGTILPLGGVDNGHKGFALALMLKALTEALAGGARVEDGKDSQTVMVQLFSPAAFGGAAGFERHMSEVVEACLASEPTPGNERVRLPGQRSLESRRRQLASGVEVRQDVSERVAALGLEVGVMFPEPLLG